MRFYVTQRAALRTDETIAALQGASGESWRQWLRQCNNHAPMKSGSSHLRLVGTSAGARAATWLTDVGGHLAPPDREALRRVLEFVGPLYADGRLPAGEPVLDHVLSTAVLLAA